MDVTRVLLQGLLLCGVVYAITEPGCPIRRGIVEAVIKALDKLLNILIAVEVNSFGSTVHVATVLIFFITN